ncbi:Transcriptional regulatory protein, C terminal [Lentzea waywayandensis]|uniref:Transcriptional regulatory protein, C terminal n=1 Tax=Lentzea waywayandensis TaxID=84724 RepID=A0A1I6FGT1_9PSEU|nr:AAA family ATPase [Lentzea waywayandensis]SFR29104.1 Transcriptional regulatory protein, C terminal [Lentzea waywayandensis]
MSPRLHILGPLRVWRDGAEVDAGPRQQAYLLALLLVRAGRPVTTSELIGLVWGDDAPTSALNVIHKYVGALRRLLEPANPARSPGSYLHRRGNAYLFTAGPDTLDLVAFRELVDTAKAAQARSQHEAALEHYVEALGLWQGPAGDGLAHGPTAMAIFAALDDEFRAACEAAADLAVSLRRPERVLPALQLAAKTAPFHEPVQAGLISLLGSAGRQAEALSAFRELRARLADELGIDPGPALQDAYLRVLTQSPAPEPDPDSAPVRGADLVGRTEELAALRQAVEAAFTGRTGLAVVEGEPGVGKTRLLEEAAADANRRGALVVWASCLEGDGAPSMWPWEQALTTVLDSLPAPAREKWLGGELGGLLEERDDHAAPAASGSRAQFRLFEQVVTVVGQAVGQRPVVLIIDDLQWADTASLHLFGHLATRLPAGAAIIGALRDRAPSPGSDLSRVLAAASRLPGHRRFRLGPLDLTAVTELVRRETGREPGADIARTIHSRTAGNPFFVRELSRLLSDSGALGDASAGVPSTVRDVVRDRMAGLDDHTRDLLRIAALIGRDVELDLLARAAALDLTECLELLEPLRALGLLEPTADPFSLRFAHDLVRESITETTARQQAMRLHLRIADALEDQHADESITERLAYHLQAAGPLADPVRTAEALKRAGRRATAKLAFAAADRHLQSAAQIARTAGLPELELSALSLLAIAPRRQAGYGGTTFDLLERAELLARQLSRDVEAAGLLFARLFGAYTFLEWDRERLVRRLREQGEASSDPVVRVYGRQAWGLHQWDVGNIGEAHRCFEANNPAVLDGVVSAHSDTPIRRDVSGEWPGWRAVVTALHGDVEKARTMIDQWNGPDDPYAVATWAYYLTIIGATAGDADLVIRTVERWIAVGTGRAAVQQEHYVRLNWCWARALTGDDPAGVAAEAEELLAASLADPPRWGVAFHNGLVAEMWLTAGKLDYADIALDRADKALEANGQRYAEGLVRLLRARLLHARGEPVDVVRAAAEEARAFSAGREAHLFARRAQEFLAGLDRAAIS